MFFRFVFLRFLDFSIIFSSARSSLAIVQVQYNIPLIVWSDELSIVHWRTPIRSERNTHQQSKPSAVTVESTIIVQRHERNDPTVLLMTFPNGLILSRGPGLRLRLCDRLHDGIARVTIRITTPVVPRTDPRAGANLLMLTFTTVVTMGDRASFAKMHIGFRHVGIGRVTDEVAVFRGRDGATDEYEAPQFAILRFRGITVC